MPNWQPKWDNVVFDHGETNEAISLCQGALITLADRHAVLQGPYEMACLNWRGVKRFRFDAEWSAMHAHAEAVAQQLRAHIARLREDSDSALLEQRFREDERARWFREAAAEEAAAAAAREAQRIAAAHAAAALSAQQAATAAAAAQLVSAQQLTKPALVFAPIISSGVASGSSQPVEPTPFTAVSTSAPSAPVAPNAGPSYSPPATRASGQVSSR